MSGFAPSYYHASNNAWLNDLVGDIIDPGKRTRRKSSSRELVEDPIEALDSDSECQSAWSRHSPYHQTPKSPPMSYHRASPPSQKSQRLLSFEGSHRHSHRSTVSSASQSSQVFGSPTSGPEMFQTISENDSALVFNPFHESRSSSTAATAREYSISRTASSSQKPKGTSSRQSRAMSARDSVSLDQEYAEKSRFWHTTDAQRLGQPSRLTDETLVETIERDERTPRNIPQRTSLGRTYSQKQFTDVQKPPLARIPSGLSEDFSGFSPHPAVRPFNYTREKLGEAAGPADEDNHEYPKPLALALIITGVCLSVFIISVDRNIVTTAIPQITETFHSYSDIGWYGSAYFLTASAFQPLYGRVYMSFDTRWSFLVALGIFELGSLLGAVSPTSQVLILGRAVQGFGSAGILTGSFVVATHSVPLRGRPVLFAFVGILYGVGALAGPLLGGAFTDFLTWRWAFWINLPIGAVTFVAVFFFFKPGKSKGQDQCPSWTERLLQLDLTGNAIILGACTMLFLALQMSETRGNWDSAPVVGLLCGFGVTVILFICWLLYRGDKALIPPRIIKQRTVAASCGVAFFLYGGLLVHAYYLPIWFQAIKGDSAVHSGVNMIPYMLANAVFSLMAGIFVSKNGFFAPPAIIGTAIGTIGSGLFFTLNVNTSTSTWIGYEILVSAGLGMAIQQGFSAVQTTLPLEEVPIGTAAVVASQSLGGAIFVSIGNTVLQNHLLNQNADRAIPGVDVRAVFEIGATAFRSFVPADSLPALIQLYNRSLQYVFILAIALVGCSFLCALCMEWNSVKAKQESATKSEKVEA